MLTSIDLTASCDIFYPAPPARHILEQYVIGASVHAIEARNHCNGVYDSEACVGTEGGRFEHVI